MARSTRRKPPAKKSKPKKRAAKKKPAARRAKSRPAAKRSAKRPARAKSAQKSKRAKPKVKKAKRTKPKVKRAKRAKPKVKRARAKPAKKSVARKRATAKKKIRAKAKPARKARRPKAAAKKKVLKKKVLKKKVAKKVSRKANAPVAAPKAPEPTRPARSAYEVPPQVQNPKLSRLQIRELRAMLEDERTRLIQEISNLAGRDLSENRPDQPNRFGNHLADVASDNQMLETLLVQSGMEADRLREVTEALERIDRHRFGICERCGANIGWDRLQAKPYAHMCIVCRAHFEKIAS
jgi:RNA polymerase-binding protein DksA